MDAGNDTGDAYVEDLNRSQLGRDSYGYGRNPAPYYAPSPYGAVPGYYEPRPYYYAPPNYGR